MFQRQRELIPEPIREKPIREKLIPEVLIRGNVILHVKGLRTLSNVQNLMSI
ncbi:hypothetical protein D3C74_500310 [compost metagenome]